MRITLVLVLTAALVLMLCIGAMAGDYHTGSRLKCYQCHVMHATKSHAYGDDSHDDWNPRGAATTHDNLLKDEDVNAMCLECHDKTDSIDVYGAGEVSQPARRAGGQFNGDTAAAYAPFESNNGHDLSMGSKQAPGGAGSYDMDCASCHDPHGNSYYRNLNEVSTGVGVTYAKTTNDTTKDVFEAKPWGGGNSVAVAYDEANVSYNKTNGASHRMEQFCVKCHTDVHSAGATNGSWLKHPTIGYSVAYTQGTVSALKTIGGTTNTDGTVIAGDVSCVTCHKAHGSTHPFGLIYDNRTTAGTEDGTSLAQTCKHCHAKALTATE